MAKKERIVKHTAKKLIEQSKRGKTSSNWAKAAAMTPAQIEADVAVDPDEVGMVMDWDNPASNFYS